MSLQLRRVDSSTRVNPALTADVLKASALAAIDSARGVLEAAQQEAASILEQARVQANRLAHELLRQREDELSRREAKLEQQMWQRTARFSDAVSREWERTLADVETRAVTLVGQALSRLTHEAPAESRLRACVNALLAQAGTPDGGVLWVSQDDHAVVLALGPLPWPVHASGALPSGTVRLQCAQGRWECDLAGALDRLLAALATAENHVDEQSSNEALSKETDNA